MGTPLKEHLCKVLVVGDLGVGKTSIIQRYVHKVYSQHYRATIGVDFALKVIKWGPETIIRLQLWDIAGQERFGNMTRLYYRDAVGAFIVFDVTRASTFEAVPRWKDDLDSKVSLQSGKPIPIILLANKCDQLLEGLGTELPKLDHFCRDNGFSGWFETSAKDNLNIDEAASCLIKNMVANDKGLDSKRDPHIVLPTLKNKTLKNSNCSNCAKF
ncbi:ras-related protein Rab-38-like [Lissotriton helveticus]